jgi:hypothetical protein
MAVWAGDDSPSKRDRQPLFLFSSRSVLALYASAKKTVRNNLAFSTLTLTRPNGVFYTTLYSLQRKHNLARGPKLLSRTIRSV